MKPLDDKDKPKLFALIGLAVCLFGFAAFQFAGASSSGAAPAPAAPVAPKEDLTQKAIAATTAADQPTGPVFDPKTLGFPTGGKDPFVPNGSAVAVGAPPPVAPPAPVSPIPVAQKPNNFADILNQNPPPAPAQNAGASGEAGAALQPPPPPPSYVVTGIVMGDEGENRNVAILRGSANGGGDERRFVVGGEDVGHGFFVAAIRANSVELKDRFSSRRVVLKLANASDAPRETPSPSPTPEGSAQPTNNPENIQKTSGDNARAK
jgi:hypothetical protein